MDEKILHKVRALLNLARNGGDPDSNEAQSALLMAQRFMAENGIDELEVEGSIIGSPRHKEVVDEYVTEFEKLSWWKKSLGRVIAPNFRCYSYLNKRVGYTRLVFLGLKQDAEIAAIAFSFATDSIKLGANQYMKMYRKDYILLHGSRPSISKQREVRNNYVEGWISGLEAQYAQQVSKEGWGLVLTKDPSVTQSYQDLGLKRGQPSQHSREDSSAGQLAYAKGYSDGKVFRASHGRIR